MDSRWVEEMLFSDIRRELGKRFDKKYVVATMKHPPIQVFWDAMSWGDWSVFHAT